jgi:hypothetical protein
MKRVTGIGGIFFKSESPPQLYDWYEKHLGIQRESHGQGASFHWREPQAADGTEPVPKALTVMGTAKAKGRLTVEPANPTTFRVR